MTDQKTEQETSDDYPWDQLEYKSLDEIPEDFESVDYSVLLAPTDLTYYEFKDMVSTWFSTVDDGTLDEELLKEFNALVDDREGRLFFQAHIEARPIDGEVAYKAFLEHMRMFHRRESTHQQMLKEQASSVADSRDRNIPSTHRLDLS